MTNKTFGALLKLMLYICTTLVIPIYLSALAVFITVFAHSCLI